MGSSFEPADADSFFEKPATGMTERALIIGTSFTREVYGIFDLTSQDVALAAETGVDVDEPVIECKTVDVEGVKRGMLLSMPDLRPSDDGFGKNYQIVRIRGAAGPQSTLLYLNEV